MTEMTTAMSLTDRIATLEGQVEAQSALLRQKGEQIKNLRDTVREEMIEWVAASLIEVSGANMLLNAIGAEPIEKKARVVFVVRVEAEIDYTETDYNDADSVSRSLSVADVTVNGSWHDSVDVESVQVVEFHVADYEDLS